MFLKDISMYFLISVSSCKHILSSSISPHLNTLVVPICCEISGGGGGHSGSPGFIELAGTMSLELICKLRKSHLRSKGRQKAGQVRRQGKAFLWGEQLA